MFVINAFVALLAFAAPFHVRADVDPSEPAPGSSFNAGSTCVTTWDGDTNSTSIWKNMAIELMTGNNFQMIHLTTIATNQDGTVSGRLAFPCPQVTPNAAIYFLQFSNPQAPNKAWTTRFTIASSDGKSTPPPNAVQPGTNEPIPWGIGSLVDPSQAVAAPSFAPSGSSALPLSSLTASAPVAVVTPSSIGAASRSTPPIVTIVTISSSSSIQTSSTNLASPTAQSNRKASGTLGAMIGFDVRVLGAAAVATLAFSFV